MGCESFVSIKVIGVGGGGNSMVNRMISAGVKSVDFIAVDTDKRTLETSNAATKIQIGEKLTNGQGTEDDCEVGRKAAEESQDQICKALEGADMVFITVCMGGGTGTGTAPVVADIAKKQGVLTIGLVTKPFLAERSIRKRQAEAGIADLRDRVDSLVIIPRERLKLVYAWKISLAYALEIADDMFLQTVKAICDPIQNTGFISLDFANVSAVMKNNGCAYVGVGRATGWYKAEVAARMAVSSPLMECGINGATGVIINIAGPVDIGLEEVETAARLVGETAQTDNIILGATFDEELENEIRVTVIATGFESSPTSSLSL